MDLIAELMQSPQTRALSLIVAGQVLVCLAIMAMLVRAVASMWAPLNSGLSTSNKGNRDA